MLYSALDKGPYKVAGYHDPDSRRLVGILFRPPAWQANTVYELRSEDDYDIVLPTVYTGTYAKVKSPGKSGALDPFNGDAPGDEITDGSALWEIKAYNLLPMGVTVVTVGLECTNSVTVSSQSTSSTACDWMIEPLPAEAIAAGSFEVKAHVTYSNDEEEDITLKFTVGQR